MIQLGISKRKIKYDLCAGRAHFRATMVLGNIMSKKRAEHVFQSYLHSQNLKWEYEALPGRMKPDYLVHHLSGKCIVEVKEIEDPNPLPTDEFDPLRSVRNKIKRARAQFREYKEYSCSLALFSESMFGPSEASTVLAAAFGPGYQQGGRDYSRIDRHRLPP